MKKSVLMKWGQRFSLLLFGTFILLLTMALLNIETPIWGRNVLGAAFIVGFIGVGVTTILQGRRIKKEDPELHAKAKRYSRVLTIPIAIICLAYFFWHAAKEGFFLPS